MAFEISVIIPKYKPDKNKLEDLRAFLANQNVEIIEIEGLNGLANAYNEGIKRAHGSIIITIHQDCLPLEPDAITKLVEPIKSDSNVVMAYSWILDEETNKKYYATDGKFLAYRKSALESVDLFDEKTYFTGGEDLDIYLKLKQIGKIVKVDTGIIHMHKGYLGNSNLEKRKQNASINGCLFRVWKFKNPFWWRAIIQSIIHPVTYGQYFIIGFMTKKQNIRRNN